MSEDINDEYDKIIYQKRVEDLFGLGNTINKEISYISLVILGYIIVYFRNYSWSKLIIILLFTSIFFALILQHFNREIVRKSMVDEDSYEAKLCETYAKIIDSIRYITFSIAIFYFLYNILIL